MALHDYNDIRTRKRLSAETGRDLDLSRYGEAHIDAIAKSHFLLVVPLQVALLGPMNADDRKPDECGLESVYSSLSEKTASGEDTIAGDFTAAHRTLPFGTLVHVDNQENERYAVVRITDRGPFISGRVIDISQAAARALGNSGLTPVCLNVTWVPEGRLVRGN